MTPSEIDALARRLANALIVGLREVYTDRVIDLRPARKPEPELIGRGSK